MSYYISTVHVEGKFAVLCSATGDVQHSECFSERTDAINYINYLNGGDGLTKRERFAMAAMQGIIGTGFDTQNTDHVNEICRQSVQQADAIIKALEGEL